MGCCGDVPAQICAGCTNVFDAKEMLWFENHLLCPRCVATWKANRAAVQARVAYAADLIHRGP